MSYRYDQAVFRINNESDLAVAPSGPLSADEEKSRIDKILDAAGDETVDETKWGIRNGCITHTRIKRVHFTSNEIGVIELVGGDKVVVTLRNRCSGIRNEGYVHKPVNGKFCEGDMLRVIHYGTVCTVDKIRPYQVSADE